MKAFCSLFLVAISTTFIYEAVDARAFFGGLESMGGGIPSMFSSFLAPGKAGNEGEFRLPAAKAGAQPQMSIGRSGMMNNGQLAGLGQQAFGAGAGRMMPNGGQGAMFPNSGSVGMPQNNQFRGNQQPMAMGTYKGQALNRAGRR